MCASKRPLEGKTVCLVAFHYEDRRAMEKAVTDAGGELTADKSTADMIILKVCSSVTARAVGRQYRKKALAIVGGTPWAAHLGAQLNRIGFPVVFDWAVIGSYLEHGGFAEEIICPALRRIEKVKK
ncbi:MAG: hypothetical protein Q8N84_04045 [bacterium]|nr:hypothetical protein [bacterium]